jgi:subtilase family serine protease
MKKTTALTLMLVAGAFAAAPAHAATGSGSTTAPTDTRDYTLTVASAHGNPSPAVGTHTYAWQATVSASVEAEADGHTCTGWTGTGSVPETGATHATGDIQLDQVASSITWQWEAEAQTHTVTLHPGAHGSIAEANDGNSFVTNVAHGAAFPAVTVVPDAGYTFTGWNPAAPETVTEDFEATAEYQAQGGGIFIEDFEMGGFSPLLPWVHSGHANWSVQSGTVHGGAYAAEAPRSIGDNQSSAMEFEAEFPAGGQISFWLSVSSEANYDFLRFYINGHEQNRWSGNVAWRQVTYDVPAGNHTFRWQYTKDGSVSHGQDTAWVDDITLLGVSIGTDRIGFETVAQTVFESDGVADVRIVTQPVLAQDASVVLHVDAATTALPGHDYTIQTSEHVTDNGDGTFTVTVPAGQPATTVTVVLYDNDEIDGSRFLVLNASNPVNAEVRIGTHTLTIVDDDFVRPIGEFPTSTGVTFLLGGNHNNHVMAYYGSAVRIDEQGNVHVVYGNYNTVNHAECRPDGTVISTLVDTVSKRNVRPGLARNDQGYYIVTEEWDRTPTYNSYYDSRLYHKPIGENWSKLQDIQLNVHSEAGGAKDVVGAVKEAPDGHIHIIFRRHGWWSYGFAHKVRILDKSTHSLGPLTDISARSSSHPDTGRNVMLNGMFYLTDSNTLVAPFQDHHANTLFLAESAPVTYDSWTDIGNIPNTAHTVRWDQGMWQDADENVHASFVNHSSFKLYYSFNWNTPVEVASLPANRSDIAVYDGKVYILFSHRIPENNRCGNLYLIYKPLDGDQWSEPEQVTFESVGYNNALTGQFFFARPFGYGQQTPRLCFAYTALDGVASGNDYLDFHLRVIEVGSSTPPATHTVTFDLDGKGERVGGGALVQQVPHGGAAVAPEVEALPDWIFTGWDRSFNNVTGPMTVKALYDAVHTPLPDLSLSAADLRILNAAGAETWNPAVGEAVTVEVTLRNTGEAATSDDILVQLFLDGAPADLSSYDLAAFTVAASTVVAESMSVDGSRTLLLPWTATGPDRVATLTAVAEFAANRAQSQANAEGASEPLPVAEVSFANNSVGRSIQIGSPAEGEFGIEVEAEAPADMLSGVSYTLTGTARYDWDANEPVLGALVTVTVGDTTATARTVAPDGAWSVTLPGLPEGNHPALVQVHDGRLTGSTTLTLVVSAGPETRDLRITEFGFVSGAYRVEGQTAYAATGDSLVLRARVRNDGNAPCGPFEVAFKDPAGTAFSTVTVPGLGAFSSVWVEADAGWTVEAGTHTLSALADSNNAIEETNEHNNSRTCTVIGTAALPDLVPVSISFAPGGPKAGDSVTITTVIENRGGAMLPSGTAFDVAFSVNGTVVATETAAPSSDLAPGASLTVSTTHTFAEHGAFTVGVRADSGDDIDETREDNNALSRTLTVRKALPDLRPFYRPNAWTTVSGLSFSPSQPVAGEAVTVSCDIYNAGTVPLGAGAAFDVRFSAGDTPFATERVILGADLPVGGKVTVTSLWNGGPAGPVTIAADVDTEDEIEEEHETNNRTTRGMTVFPADAALVAASLTTSPLQPLPGSAVILTATIRNNGGAAGGAGATVEFFAGSTDPSDKIGETTLDADLAPKNGTATAAFAWTAPATPGVVPLFAKVGDSTAQRDLTVTANPAPNLQVFSEDIAFDPPLPSRGASVTVSATVRNTEGSAATDFLVRFYVEAPGIGFVDLVTPVTVASLAVGAETTVQANAPIIAERSAYTVKVELVPNPEQGDADASDNAATSSFVLADTPVADAGADSACIVGQTATLDGTASRNATAYAWTLIERPAGSEAELAGANTATPSLTPDLPGLYRAQLIVSDGLIQSTPDTVAITARYLTLEVISAHGEPDPAVGIHSYAWQAAVDVQSTEVDEVDPGRTRHLCTGWVGSGSVPTEGDAATVSFTIAEDSTLTWQWATEHWLQVDPEGSGTVSVDSGWQPSGSEVVLTVTPDADHRFTGWSGDIEDCVIDGLEITVPMNGPRTLTATFVSALHTVTLHQGLYGQIAGADGGGAYTVTVAYGNAFPEVNVTPSAGFLFAGWSPAAPAVIEADFEAAARYRPDANVIAMAAAEILASAHAQQAHGLYTPEALRHLFPSPLMIEVDPVTGEVHIDLQMQWSDDLSNWQPFGEILRWIDAETSGKRFYRLQLMEPVSDE